MDKPLIFVFMPIRRKDELHSLVLSLGKGEKKFFHILAASTRGEKNYMRLFSALERMKGYDEEKLKRRFAGTTLAKNLASEKQYLFKQIIYALRIFHAENSAALRIDSRIAEIEALMDKRLFAQCERMIQKARSESALNELYPHLMTLHHLSAKLAIRSGNYDYLYKGNMHALPLLRKASRDFLEQEEMRALSYKLFALVNRAGNISSQGIRETDKLMKDPLLTKPPVNGTFYTLVYYYQAHNFYHYHKGHIEKAYKLNQQLIKLFENRPEKIGQNPQTYFSFLRNLSNRAYGLGKYAECYQCLRKMEQLETDYGKTITASLRTDIRVYGFEIKVELLCTESKFHEAVSLCKGMGEYVSRNAGKLRIQSILYYHLFSAISLTGTSKYREALVFINRILNDKQLNVRHDMVLFAHLINVLIHYELKNIELIRGASANLVSYNQKNELGFKCSGPLHNMFLGLVKANGNKAKCKTIIAWAMEGIKPLLKTYDEKRMLHITGLLDWMKARG